MFTIGPKAMGRKATSSIPEASADDPIYTRGFAVGEMRSRPSSKVTEEEKKRSLATPSEEPPDQYELQASNLYEKGLQEALDKNLLTKEPITPENKEPV